MKNVRSVFVLIIVFLYIICYNENTAAPANNKISIIMHNERNGKHGNNRI
jgi:hypothetical protein